VSLDYYVIRHRVWVMFDGGLYSVLINMLPWQQWCECMWICGCLVCEMDGGVCMGMCEMEGGVCMGMCEMEGGVCMGMCEREVCACAKKLLR